jgi:hypothetical protein
MDKADVPPEEPDQPAQQEPDQPAQQGPDQLAQQGPDQPAQQGPDQPAQQGPDQIKPAQQGPDQIKPAQGLPPAATAEIPPDPKLDNVAGLTIAFDKGDVVKVGDRVSYKVTTSQPGYLTIFDMAPDGTLMQIFPNERALKSPTGSSPEALRVRPDRPRMIPDYRNPYAAFDVVIKEPRGKGLMVAVLSEQPLVGAPALPRKFSSRKLTVVALGKMRNYLRAMRGLAPVALEQQVVDSAAADDVAQGGPGNADPAQDPQPVPPTAASPPAGGGDADRPKWSVVAREYEIR